MVESFPGLTTKLRLHSRRYQDKMKQQRKEAMRRVEYFTSLTDEMIEEVVFSVKQEMFEDGNVIFQEGDTCKGVVFVMGGEIELSYQEGGKSIVVDRLGAGSYLFSYTCLSSDRLSLSGTANGKTNVLVLPTQVVADAREANEQLDFELSRIEDYIEDNGVPRCDYTRFRAYLEPPIKRFQAAIKRLIALQKIENQKALHFTDLLNVIHKRKGGGGGDVLFINASRAIRDSQSGQKFARHLSRKFGKISSQLRQHEKMMESM